MGTHNRTWLCCVVFLDVVGFTKHDMQSQMEIKVHLDTQLKNLLNNTAKDEYILLDRGDGAAVCFLVEPETALYFSLDLRDAIGVQKDSSIPYQVRVGINLGPVKIVLDANGDKSTLGDGINCAARIMDFAGPGQIFVSRSFYEVIGCLSQEYSELFSYLGKKADKHVREFDIYEVAPARAGRVNRNVEPSPPATQLDIQKWNPEALQSRVTGLTEKLGPMARILVQRTAQQAETLEELDRILSEPETLTSPDSDSLAKQGSTGFENTFLEKAERLLGVYLGPIANVLVKQAAGKASDTADLIQILADELSNNTEKQTFISSFKHEP